MATSLLPDALWNLIESFLPGPDAQSPRWKATPVRSPPDLGQLRSVLKLPAACLPPGRSCSFSEAGFLGWRALLLMHVGLQSQAKECLMTALAVSPDSSFTLTSWVQRR
jgi:hypothetical protein